MKRTAEKTLAFISGILGTILSLVGVVTIILYRAIEKDPTIIEAEEFDMYRDTVLEQVEGLTLYTYISVILMLIASILALIAAIKLSNHNNRKMGIYLIIAALLFIVSQSWIFAILTLIAGIMALRKDDAETQIVD